MIRIGVIVFLLLSAISTAFSQALKLEVENKPLSEVLNMLGCEISFDYRAMSAYRVSVSESFQNYEDALSRLLENKPFHIEKIEAVYVIIPDEERTSMRPKVTKEKFAFRGMVIDKSSNEPLEYATVSLLCHDGKLLRTGITTGEGQFYIETAERPEKLTVGYIGHETLMVDVRNRNETLGVLMLRETAIPLNETVVTTSGRKLNRTVYPLKPEISGVNNVLDFIDQIPGVHYDRLLNLITINGHTNVLLLVDGIEYSQAYLQHLPLHRIQSVEITQAPSGHFVSDDYAAIINIMLKKNYSGYDITASSTALLNISKSSAYSRLAESLPTAGMIFTTRKWNFFGMYLNERKERNIYSSKELTYGKSLLASIAAAYPNNLYQYENKAMTGGVNYQVAPRHLVGIQSDYTFGNLQTRLRQSGFLLMTSTFFHPLFMQTVSIRKYITVWFFITV